MLITEVEAERGNVKKQIAKYPTYVEWAYQTIARFWEMSQDSNIRQCWTEQEWQHWIAILARITLNLPNDEHIVVPA